MSDREDDDLERQAHGGALRRGGPTKAEKRALLRPDSLEQARLELEGLDDGEKLERLRGAYDVTRLDPAKRAVISFLLGVPGAKMDRIAKFLGVAWETVQAVSVHYQMDVREFQERFRGQAMMVALTILGDIQLRAETGEANSFDLDVVMKWHQLLSGQATHRVEHTITLTAEERLLRSMAAQALGQMTAGMGLAGGNVPALAGSADGLPGALGSDAPGVVDVAFERVPRGEQAPDKHS